MFRINVKRIFVVTVLVPFLTNRMIHATGTVPDDEVEDGTNMFSIVVHGGLRGAGEEETNQNIILMNDVVEQQQEQEEEEEHGNENENENENETRQLVTTTTCVQQCIVYLNNNPGLKASNCPSVCGAYYQTGSTKYASCVTFCRNNIASCPTRKAYCCNQFCSMR